MCSPRIPAKGLQLRVDDGLSRRSSAFVRAVQTTCCRATLRLVAMRPYADCSSGSASQTGTDPESATRHPTLNASRLRHTIRNGDRAALGLTACHCCRHAPAGRTPADSLTLSDEVEPLILHFHVTGPLMIATTTVVDCGVSPAQFRSSVADYARRNDCEESKVTFPRSGVQPCLIGIATRLGWSRHRVEGLHVRRP